ncbi:MAG: acyl-CoA dehydrogenase [Alphaproteobacteria bacterium]
MTDGYIAWRRRISKPLLAYFRRVLPPISDTEREALEAGTVWWDGELFSGKPDWAKLRGFSGAKLTSEEQDFLDGPVEELCAMLDEWRIRQDHDLPPEAWRFMRDNGFMGMIIPKGYGGLEFSALAHSSVVMKISTRSLAAAVTVMVPNSLGPAELLLRYGADEQKRHYLPRLAKGDEIPCFALTGPEAGSDAASIPDTGIVCLGEFNGNRTLGMRLSWDKRYITLAPVATLLGIAFRLRDPDHLIGGKEDIGITLALIPAETPGVEIGRRHIPAGQGFLNGPTSGKDVFVPLDFIIGGKARAGQGWRMLMEALAAGRSISLPALSTGACKFAARNAGAYAAVRRQFGVAIGKFEGVEAPLARIAASAYVLDAARVLTCGAIDAGQQPSVLSAILKYHATERMRAAVNDGMDILGGRGIIDGPRNFMFSAYQSIPVAITVEGANILTRSLIIFGQGAIRCHPHLLKEMEAAQLPDEDQALEAFDKALFAHIRGMFSNMLRAFIHNLTGGAFSSAPSVADIGWIYRRLHAAAVTFAVVTDFVMGTLGGTLKRREALSARLGDVLSEMYLLSCTLKQFEDDGAPAEDLPLVQYAARDSLCRIQRRLDSVLVNMPMRPLAWLARLIAFPLGRHRRPPKDKLVHACAKILLSPSDARDRLTAGMFVSNRPDDATGRLEAALIAAVARDRIEEKVRKALGSRGLRDGDVANWIEAKAITQDEAGALAGARRLIAEAIAVDSFSPDEVVTPRSQDREIGKPGSAAA